MSAGSAVTVGVGVNGVSFGVSVAVGVKVIVGVKVMVNDPDVPEAIVVGRGATEMLKSDASPAVKSMVFTVRSAVPLLMTVMVTGLLEEPSSTFEKSILPVPSGM